MRYGAMLWGNIRRVSSVSDEAYSGTWDGVTRVAPSKNAVYDKINSMVRVSYNPTTMTVQRGTLTAGTVADLAAVGGTDVSITELAGTDPLRVEFEFSGVARLTSFVFLGNYSGGASHVVWVEAYNHVAGTWDFFGEFGKSTTKQWYSFNIFQPDKYISSGVVKVRLNHQGNGINTHYLTLDYVDVNFGGAGGGTNTVASTIGFVPTGNVSATNVQAAIQELDNEKASYTLDTGWIPKWDGSKLVNHINPSTQELSGTTVAWNVNNGINGTITLSGNTTITLSNLVAGTSGNLSVTNPASLYTLTVSGYTNKISQTAYLAANQLKVSGSSKLDIFSWYYDGTYLWWNGGQDYK